VSGALRELLAVFGTEVDDSGLKKGQKGVESFKSTLKEFGETLIAAFAVERIIDFSKEILESADVLAKQSAALSVSAADLQGWQFAAKLSGSSAEEFSAAFTKFNRNVAEAGKGTGPAADAFKALGVSIKDSTGKAGQPIKLLDGVADALAGMQDPAKRTEAIMALFGKSGAKLLPLFQEGSAGIAKLRAEVGELGASFDEAFLENAQEVNDNLDRLKLGVRGLAIQAIGPLLPTIVSWTQKGIDLIKSIVELTKHSSSLQAALVTFGTVGAAKAISGLVGLAQKAGFLKAGLRGVLFELAPLVLGFLAIEDVWTFLTGGSSVTGDLIEKFFGKDAPAKVRAFAATLKETGLADLGLLLKGAFAIFTDGKPLTQKFQDLLTFIESDFRRALKRDFGEVGDSIATWASALTTVVDILNRIVAAMGWIATHTVNAIGKSAFASEDAELNNAAKNNALLRDNPQKRASADDFKGGWFKQVVSLVTGFDPQEAADAINKGIDQRSKGGGSGNLDAQSIRESFAPTSVSAPVLGGQGTTQVEQNVRTQITQQFYATTPEEVQRSASDGVKSGVSKSSDLLATQAAIKKTGA